MSALPVWPHKPDILLPHTEGEVDECSYLTDRSIHLHYLAHLNYPLLTADIRTPLVFDERWQAMIAMMMDVWFSSEEMISRIRDRLGKPRLVSEDVTLQLTIGFRDCSDFFSICNDRNLHSALVIGKLMLNPLRSLIPTFTYTYSAHRGNGLIWNGQEEVGGWLYSSGSYDYLYTEGITEGISLDLLFHDQACSAQDFRYVLYQIIGALSLAHSRYRFTHNALHHPESIVIRQVGTCSLPIYFDEEVSYITSGYIAQIRDYRWATCTGESFIPDVLNLVNALLDRLRREDDVPKYHILEEIMSWKESSWHRGLVNNDRSGTSLIGDYIRTIPRFYLRYAHYRSLSLNEYLDTQDGQVWDIAGAEMRAQEMVRMLYQSLTWSKIEMIEGFLDREDEYIIQAYMFALFVEKLAYVRDLDRQLQQARTRKGLIPTPLFTAILSKMRMFYQEQQLQILKNRTLLQELGIGLRQYDRLSELK